MSVVFWLYPVTNALAGEFVPALRSFIFIRTRASRNALARARANVPVHIISAIFSICDALALAGSIVPIVIISARLGSAFAAASFCVPKVIFAALLGKAITNAAVSGGLQVLTSSTLLLNANE